MRELWPSAEPADGVLVAAESWAAVIDRWVPTTHCFIHLVSWMDPTSAREEAHELVMLSADLAHRDDVTDLWDVLRVVIVDHLSAGIPAYFDWLVDRDEPTREVVAAMRRLPARDQLLLCLYDEAGRTSRHEEGRFRPADLALLLGIDPTSVRLAVRTARRRLQDETHGATTSDDLDLLRAPVPVGGVVTTTPDGAAHRAIDAPAITPARPSRPATRSVPVPTRPPPDPLGVLDPATERVLTANEPRGGRTRWLAGALAACAALAVGVAAYAGVRGHGGGTGDGVVAGVTAPVTDAPPGTVAETQLAWGPDPGVCPAGQAACYSVGVVLEGYAPASRVAVTCVVPDRPSPAVVDVTVDGSGGATVRVPCATSRAARSIDILVDDEAAATIELPTTIVPTPTPTPTAPAATADTITWPGR